MQSSSDQPLDGEECYVTTLITAAKETRSQMELKRFLEHIGVVGSVTLPSIAQ